MQHTRGDLQADERLVPSLTLAAFVTVMGALALGTLFPLVADELGASVALLGQAP